eukprot:1301116-Pleurochrysis_carterae.AAC.1
MHELRGRKWDTKAFVGTAWDCSYGIKLTLHRFDSAEDRRERFTVGVTRPVTGKCLDMRPERRGDSPMGLPTGGAQMKIPKKCVDAMKSICQRQPRACVSWVRARGCVR